MAELSCQKVRTPTELSRTSRRYMKSKLADAFEEASQGYSADRVVADPALNSQFILACGRRGLSAPVAMLNRSLLNLRKQGGLRGRRRSKRTHFANEDEYRFAAEMAARFLERRDGVSLDDIISDAERVAEFDELAASTAPGHSALQYRWAALNLRKGKRLEPELVARISPPVEILSYRADEIKLAELPSSPGVYLFFASHQLLYVGETSITRTTED